MATELAVLEALIEQLERFALFGSCEGGQVAAAHPALCRWPTCGSPTRPRN
jgi:hypothetical protein